MGGRQEAEEIMEEFGLKERDWQWWVSLLRGEASYRDYSEEEFSGVLEVPYEVFGTLFGQFNPKYVYEYVHPGDDSGGYGFRDVWFITENKLRIQTTSTFVGPFMEDVLYPSMIAQEMKVKEYIGDRETTFEEIDSVKEEMGFRVLDPLSGEMVEKYEILPSQEAEKFKSSIVSMKIRTGEDERD